MNLRTPPAVSPALRLRRRRGWSLVEVMISLTISALLLTAVATAFSASTGAIEQNDRFFRASQASRVSLNQVLDMVRRSDAVELTDDPSPPAVVYSNYARILTSKRRSDGTLEIKDRTYKFENNAIWLVDNDVIPPKEYRLASNVISAQFSGEMKPHPQTNVPRCVRVTLDIVVRVGKNEVHLRSSTVPRRTLTY